MLLTKASLILGLVAVSQAISIRERHALPQRGTRTKRQAANTCLQANVIATGSQDDGQDPPVDGQAKSAVDFANFINFCSGQDITNGLQNEGGSCNPIPMGKIPSKSNMISAIIISPKPGEDIAADTTFTLEVKVTNLIAGSFTNAQKTYYAAPQDLQGGKIVGHTHLTVQDLGGKLDPADAPPPDVFAFFKGINDAGQNGVLSATIDGGLKAGFYRVCSMTSASNHQMVAMPVAQRGAQDDCQKFTVGQGGGNNGGANNGDANTGGDNNGGANNGDANTGGGNTGGNNAGGNNTGGGNTGGGNDAGANTGSAIAGIAAPAVTDSGNAARPFKVNNDTFVNEAAAKQRSCDIQRNGCLDAVNGGKANGATIQQCEDQATTCNAA